MSEVAAEHDAPRPRIQHVYRDRPWAWLAAGWRDLMATPGVGLTYGLIFAVAGALLTWLTWAYQIYYVTFPLIAGFLLGGPIVATGIYEASRKRAAGEKIGFGGSLRAFRRNPTQIAFFGVVLLLIFIAWVRFASLLFMLFFSDAPPPVDPIGFAERVLSVEAIPFLIVGNLIGAVLAFLTFAVSVVSIPLLLDHKEANVFTAVISSVDAVRQNFWTMLLWAWLIALFIGFGVITGFVGLILTLPLIGHASWAAYRDIIAWEETPS
jgi:uncharacterized membrane protein